MKQTPKQIKAEERQMMLAFVLIIAVLLSFHVFMPRQTSSTAELQQETVEENLTQQVNNNVLQQQIMSTIPHTTNVEVQNDFVIGSLGMNGGIFNKLDLEKYKQTVEKDSPDISLLSNNYFAYLKWNYSNKVTDLSTDWKLVQGKKLTPTTPITLVWEDNQVKINRQISIDEHYMFTISDNITNKTNDTITVSLGGVIQQSQEDVIQERSSVHTGFIALIDNKLKENAFNDVDKQDISYDTRGGWFGITQKYWQTIFIPDQQDQVHIINSLKENWYMTSFSLVEQQLSSGSNISHTFHLFAGAKDLELINQYEKNLSIPKFDLTIDFGWFYFLTKPFLYFLQLLYAWVGNMGIAILIFATLLRIALLPIVTKSYVSMAKMKKIQPQIQSLQERYKNDRPRLQREVLALYAREHVNPAGGCLPMLLQIIPFYALYKVLSVSLQMRGAPFFGWLNDLSMPDSSSIFTLCGLIPWPVPRIINIGILPVIMGATMYIQQKLQPVPASADKSQMGMFKWMPVIFTFMMGNFASGLVLYWTWSNILSIFQQRYINKKVG